MKAVVRKMTTLSLMGLSVVVMAPGTAYADKTDEIVNSGLSRIKSGASSQKRVDDLAEQTEKLMSQYNTQSKVVEGLKVYNNRLKQTLEAQKTAMTQLETSIKNASLIERQIVPLMNRMITGLEDFINGDLPFKTKERIGRLDRIKGYLTNANISAAERFRQVLQAYSIENDYGKSIAVYTDTINVGGNDMIVNMLQLGRSALYYQTSDETMSGYYNRESKTWEQLDSGHNEGIARAIKVAQKKISPELMLLPLPAPEEA